MEHDRLTSFLHERRRLVTAVWLLHATLIHWFFLGFVSWDALTYRLPPIVELVQHGRFEMEKLDVWVLKEFVPFTELPHAPFLWALGMPGLLVGYPLVVFPLCLFGVWSFVKELTKDAHAATFGVLAYAALPFVNQQPYSGYVDFIVIALLATFLWAALRLRAEGPNGRSFARLALATLAFTLARAHAIYLVVLFAPSLVYLAYVERDRFRFRIPDLRGLAVASLATLTGAAPAIYLQISRFVRYGSPMYPYQFKAFGIGTKAGIPNAKLFVSAGIPNDSMPELLKSFFSGWFWPRSWDNMTFLDSRYLGGGLVLPLALLLLPLFIRHATRTEVWIAATGAMVSFLARDFFMPRYAYGLVIAIIVVLARSLVAASASTRWRPAFFGAVAILLLHLLRPEADIFMVLRGNGPKPRLNVTRSALFLRSPAPYPFEFEPYPDLHAKLAIIGVSANEFIVPLYGARLTNELLPTIKATEIGEKCADLAPIVAREPGVLFVDDGNLTRDCERECAFGVPYWCQAYRIRPP